MGCQGLHWGAESSKVADGDRTPFSIPESVFRKLCGLTEVLEMKEDVVLNILIALIPAKRSAKLPAQPTGFLHGSVIILLFRRAEQASYQRFSENGMFSES
ncbi:hypothetical protein J1605_008711 [Eschrichtius robustus]|uniref:Uncharacterized protein n=1 Tax=Eschrichtius robustus TaxID=9764 RepID=A0AB34GWA1_ESCRO|nr:hypothetical protein J1605_008711 [Eschrichtius robustus]